ncbi:MFS transporter [Microtetraspora sp. AC03309]|uniref:MFS transporter n=1 Tax=Microtetraspora sp. AC03309 TaxID=2779376 RepID=UPI001E3431A2|nr:MFS transporter [Microtetraspora sp. AC03309]MCC5575249.1 MFS transporter [Microtetraspora sp. AC03309]
MQRHPSTATAREPLSPTARRAALAGFVGTFIEYFDFNLYATLTVYLSPLFFPADDPSTSFLTGLAVFGAGFFARPIGGILFGRLGDRNGRRSALIFSVILMGVCSTLIGILPTYAGIGIAASALLVLLRLGQGISAGSEMLGSITYVLESVPRSRRVLMASLTPMGAMAGGGVGGVVVALLSGILSREDMAVYGWRIAFLISAPLTVVALLVRKRLEDSPEFTEMVAHREITRSPLREVLTAHRRNILIAGGVAIAANGAPGLSAWFATYLAGNRALPSSTVFVAMALSSFLTIGFAPLAGWLTDRIGQRKMFAAVLCGYLVLSVPVLYLIGTVTSVAGLVVATFLYGVLAALVQAPAFTFIAELFPRHVRYTGANFGQNIGTVLGSGIAPLVGGLIFAATGSSLGPAIWVAVVCVIAFAALAMRSVQFVAGTTPADAGDETAAGAAPA